MKTFFARGCAVAGFIAAVSLFVPATASAAASGQTQMQVRYPGVIDLRVDVSDIDRKIFRVSEVIPAAPGPLKLYFPQWLPGTHSASNVVANFAGLEIEAGGKRVAWTRDPADPYAFQLTVPAGASRIDVSFQYLSPNQGRVLVTPDLMNLQWNAVVLYPAGYVSHGIQVEPRLTFPQGWKFATALETVESTDNTAHFKPVSLTDLIDSPTYIGRYFKRWDITPGDGPPVFFNVVADNAESLVADEKMIAPHRELIKQSYKVFGRPPYSHYDFLMAFSDIFGGTGGLEHRQSTEIGTGPNYFAKYATAAHQRPVVPHEFAHAWNGKFKRPADLTTLNFNERMVGTLLWVYEGGTTYWGDILSARSGLLNPHEAREMIARTVAEIDRSAGRAWRPLQDTTNEPVIGWRGGGNAKPWSSWQRGAEYYPEGALLWLETDFTLRELTQGKRSLDDFARAFYAVPADNFATQTYTFDDVVKTLNNVAPYDWAKFLRARLDSVRTDDPLDALAKSGWKLVYTEKPNTYSEGTSRQRNNADYGYSIGITVGKGDAISEVAWGSPAFDARILPGSTLVAVNGRAYKAELLARAVEASKTEGKIEFLLKTDDRYHVAIINYKGGPRHPHLERVEGTPDRLSEVLAALK